MMKTYFFLLFVLLVSCSDSGTKPVELSKKCDNFNYKGMLIKITDSDTAYSWSSPVEYRIGSGIIWVNAHLITAGNKNKNEWVEIEMGKCGFTTGITYINNDCRRIIGNLPMLGLYWNNFIFCQQRGTINILCISDDEIEGEFDIELDDNRKKVNLKGEFKAKKASQ